jgi:Tfp pilus assembly protein PilF
MTVFACLLFLAMATVFATMVRRRFPYLFTGWFWFLGTLVPVIGIVKVGSQAMADRYTYIPLIGIFIMLVWGLSEVMSRKPKGKMVLISIIVTLLILQAGISWRQTSTWRDSETLFRQALAVTKDNYLAHNSLGAALFEKGDVEGAMRQYRESIRIMPTYVNAQCNLGNALLKKRQFKDAGSCYQKCLVIQPGYAPALYNMGVALAGEGRNDEAMRQYREVLRRYPMHEDARNNLALLLAEKGAFAEAVYHFRRNLEIDPLNSKSRLNMAEILKKREKLNEAIHLVEEGLRIDPMQPEFHGFYKALVTMKRNRVDQ